MAEKSYLLTQDEIQTLFAPMVQTAQTKECLVQQGETLPALFHGDTMTGIANQSSKCTAVLTELG